MGLEMSHTIDSIQDGTKEIAETAHIKTREFHENYVSKVVPDCGKYGDAARFVAEMAPGVSEYNAIREGDWQGFAISAGIDVASIAVGAITMGAGYGAVKGGSVAAKTGVKMAAKEVAEAGAKKAVKEVAEAGAKKAVKEVAEAGAEKVVKEAVEAGAEKAVKEVAEAGAKKAAKEMVEAGAEKAAKEVIEAGTEKAAKEVIEAGAEKAAKEVAEAGAEKAAKEIAETGAEKAAKELAEEGTEKLAKETAENVTVKGVKEIGESMDKKLFPEYVEKVEEITNRKIKPEQWEKLQKALKEQDFVKLDPEACKIENQKFNRIRSMLIDEWEKNTGEKWPVYLKDVVNEKGVVLKRAGQPFDVHHLIEQSFGGSHEWWNLHPAAYPWEHQAGIHAANSISRLVF